MKKENKSIKEAISSLQYQLQRYKTMGNGTTCQFISKKLQKLIALQEDNH